MSNYSSIPYCPLMSVGNSVPIVCEQERCAWYMKGTKTCAVYILAHKSILDIKSKQN